MRFFYPAAALYAVIGLPWSVFFLRSPLDHAHEMLFGYALAVVAGNQLGPASGARVALLGATWLAARIAYLALPGSVPAAVANGAFALLLVAQVAPRLLHAAKKLRNQALPLILLGLSGAAVAFHILQFAGSGYAALRPAVLLLAMLMLFMGGRILAAAVAGQLQRQGLAPVARVQPRIEAALLLAGAGAVVGAAATELRLLCSVLSIAAGALATVRLMRWRLWQMHARPDLLCIAAGYGWLALGLAAFGASLALRRYETAALHLITVGALGTLTLGVMAMSWLLRARREPRRYAAIAWGTALIALATVSRVLSAFYGPDWLVAAALCWSAAFAVLLVLFFTTSGAASRS